MKYTGIPLLWCGLSLLLTNLTFAVGQITFYDELGFKGESVTIQGDLRSCTNVPRNWHDRASSMNTHDRCVIVFEHENCRGKSIRVEPGTPNHSRLDRLDFDNKIDSMQMCTTGNQQCSGITVDIDTREAPDLQNFGRRVKQLLEEYYPKTCKLLLSSTYHEHTRVTVRFYRFDGTANASGFSGVIKANSDYYREHHDLGSMVHELAHIVQRYGPGCDRWITEGIADWVRRYHYEPVKPTKPGAHEHYNNNHVFFLNWLNNKYPGMINTLNAECRALTYNRNIFVKITGRTADQLWEDMIREA